MQQLLSLVLSHYFYILLLIGCTVLNGTIDISLPTPKTTLFIKSSCIVEGDNYHVVTPDNCKALVQNDLGTFFLVCESTAPINPLFYLTLLIIPLIAILLAIVCLNSPKIRAVLFPFRIR